MKWSWLICLFLLLICSNAFRANGQSEKIFIKGFVIGADTNNTIPLANIMNKNTGDRYISNRYGAFGINVGKYDTLIFSVIAYQTQELAVIKYANMDKEIPIKVRLRPISYRLKDVNINANKRRQDSMARKAAIRLKTDPLLNDYSHIQSWISGSTGSPLSSLFAASNKQLQEYEKLQHLIELYREQQAVDERYTNDIIKRATGIDDKLIFEYKRFCNLPNYFILNSNDYDLVLAIRNCYEEYLTSKGSQRRFRRGGDN
ncbi:MAG: carboxypeptidase-like regulatory domain-containing protein [Bacteroidetes bacterium]|nr:carboxypeptidase-like regulatory domain-containing protein [Bacteroidota bacterium]